MNRRAFSSLYQYPRRRQEWSVGLSENIRVWLGNCRRQATAAISTTTLPPMPGSFLPPYLILGFHHAADSVTRRSCRTSDAFPLFLAIKLFPLIQSLSTPRSRSRTSFSNICHSLRDHATTPTSVIACAKIQSAPQSPPWQESQTGSLHGTRSSPRCLRTATTTSPVSCSLK